MAKPKNANGKKIFCVWNEPDTNTEGFWVTFDTLEAAVIENGNGTKVYEATLQEVGTFNVQPVIVSKPKTKALHA